jgi:F-type H+-transporting ATPase subunit c
MGNGIYAIAAAIAVLAGAGAGVGIGIATNGAVQGISRQPEASGKIMNTMILGSALAEATAIYGLVISLIILFVQWGK